MPIESSGGFIFQNSGISAQDKADFTTLMNSNGGSNSAQDQAAIKDLQNSNDYISHNAGAALANADYSAQGVHDLIYALDHDSNSTPGTTNFKAMQTAMLESLDDVQNDPNLNSADKQSFNNEKAYYQSDPGGASGL